jgi:hypothetical protein
MKRGADTSIPPKVPETLEALERAIVLLGSLSKTGLKRESRRQELEALIGRVPSQKTAVVWKTQLRGVRADMLEEGAIAP